MPFEQALTIGAQITSALDKAHRAAIVHRDQDMAPEQLEAKEADARADIFALGSVLFEMVTGKRAFTGKSQASLIGAILKDEPPPS